MTIVVVPNCNQINLTQVDIASIDLNATFGATTPPQWYLRFMSYYKTNTHSFGIHHSSDNVVFVPLIQAIEASSNHTSAVFSFEDGAIKTQRYIKLVPEGTGTLNLTLQFS